MDLIIGLIILVNIVGAIVGAIQKARGTNAPQPEKSPRTVRRPIDAGPEPEATLERIQGDQVEQVFSPGMESSDLESTEPYGESLKTYEGVVSDSEFTDGTKKERDETASANTTSFEVSIQKLRDAVILAEVVGKPRAFRPYRPLG